MVKLTEPVLAPLRRIIPRVGRIEGGALLVMLGAQMIEYWLVFGMRGAEPSLAGLAVVSAAELLELCTTVFFWAILIG